MDEERHDLTGLPQEQPPQDIPELAPQPAQADAPAGYSPQPLTAQQTFAAQPQPAADQQPFNAQTPEAVPQAAAPVPGYFPQNGAPEPNPAPAKKKKTGLIIGIVAAVLVVVAAIICALIFLGGQKKSTSANAQENNLFNQDLVTVCKDGKWGYANKKGEIVINYQFDAGGSFTDDGLALVKMNEQYGFIDKTGSFVVNPMYYDAQPFSQGLAAVKQTEDGKYGYIDKTGAMAIPAQYDEVINFSKSGLAFVEVNNTIGIIDTSGKYTVNPQYEFTDYLEITSKVIPVLNEKNPLIPIAKNEKYGYIDTTGNTIIPHQFDSALPFSNDTDVAIVENGKNTA